MKPERRDSRELHQADAATSLRGVDIRELADAARRRVSRCERSVGEGQVGAQGLPGRPVMLRRLQRITLARVIVAAQDAPVPRTGATPPLAGYLRIEERKLEAVVDRRASRGRSVRRHGPAGLALSHLLKLAAKKLGHGGAKGGVAASRPRGFRPRPVAPRRRCERLAAQEHSRLAERRGSQAPGGDAALRPS